MSVLVVKPAQEQVLRGPDFYAVVAEPGGYTEIHQRPPLTEEESDAFRDAGGEFAFYTAVDGYYEFVDDDLPEFLDEPEA
jgi:hypothetical protein